MKRSVKGKKKIKRGVNRERNMTKKGLQSKMGKGKGERKTNYVRISRGTKIVGISRRVRKVMKRIISRVGIATAIWVM